MNEIQRLHGVGLRRRRAVAARRPFPWTDLRARPDDRDIAQVRIVIENVAPQVDGGRFAVKVVAGDTVEVSADIWKDGHELLKAAVIWRKLDLAELRASHVPLPPPLPALPPRVGEGWHQAPLRSDYALNDRWFGQMTLDEVGPYAFSIVAWTDLFGSWSEELRAKVAAGQEVSSELLEGIALVEQVARTARDPDRLALFERLAELRAARDSADGARLALAPQLAELMERNDPRWDLQAFEAEIPVWADREKARFGSWYEMFPRSCGTDPRRGSTLREAEKRLPEIAAMGFDVLYLPPIHPIGRTHRKGPNNAETAGPGDPGSPWAVGAAEGGHTAVHPELGTLADFDHFLAAARGHGLEIALDFAVQCSPDHPWVLEHPDWFRHRPDGTIKYAENPPKKYQDIYPLDFETPDRAGLYRALREVVLFWCARGVRIFRVDNPHTKPQSFWGSLITEVHRRCPDALFLAEAFTRPKRMRRLAKLGFTQSYTYFTWRNMRAELEDYGNELFNTDVRWLLRPNFFATTPDILPEILQKGGRPAFLARLVLAATLSPSYGIYSGFEICENRPLRDGCEEHLDSEKYQIRVWDWDRPGHIRPLVTRVNAIRREHRALQLADNLSFLPSTDPHLIAYSKATRALDDVLVIVVNVDPHAAHEGWVTLPEALFNGRESYGVTDLLTGAHYTWHGATNYVRLDPQTLPAHVLQVARQ
jgi:starch synthase (maltosyl-transferring)